MPTNEIVFLKLADIFFNQPNFGLFGKCCCSLLHIQSNFHCKNEIIVFPYLCCSCSLTQALRQIIKGNTQCNLVPFSSKNLLSAEILLVWVLKCQITDLGFPQEEQKWHLMCSNLVVPGCSIFPANLGVIVC